MWCNRVAGDRNARIVVEHYLCTLNDICTCTSLLSGSGCLESSAFPTGISEFKAFPVHIFQSTVLLMSRLLVWSSRSTVVTDHTSKHCAFIIKLRNKLFWKEKLGVCIHFEQSNGALWPPCCYSYLKQSCCKWVCALKTEVSLGDVRADVSVEEWVESWWCPSVSQNILATCKRLS